MNRKLAHGRSRTALHALAALVLLGSAPVAGAAVLSLTGPAAPVTAGQSFDVHLEVAGIPDGEILSGLSAQILFGPSHAAFLSSEFAAGPFADGDPDFAPLFGADADGPGVLALFAFAFADDDAVAAAQADGGFRIATFGFRARQAGDAVFSFGLADATGRSMRGDEGPVAGALPLTFGPDLRVAISPGVAVVPEPATLGLLALGMLGTAALRRRRAARRA